MKYERPVIARIRTLRSAPAVLALIAAAAVAVPCDAQDTTTHPVKVNRGRIVGVFDMMTGEPLSGVEIRDITTGLSAVTTETGTLSLFFVDTTGAMIRTRKVGYRPSTMWVANSVRDTSGLTILLEPVGMALPTITISGRSVHMDPEDTVESLVRGGFYTRRNSGMAPSSAFVMGYKLNGLSMLSDSRYLMGRGICTDNLYVDGARMTVPPRGRVPRGMQGMKQGIDAIIDPSSVAAIETYREGEIPPEFNSTFSGPGSLSAKPGDNHGACATLIWLK